MHTGQRGHSSEILKRLKSGHLYAFDCDQNAIDESMPRLKAIGENFTVIHSPFENLKRELAKEVSTKSMVSLWIWVYQVRNLTMAKGGLAIV